MYLVLSRFSFPPQSLSMLIIFFGLVQCPSLEANQGPQCGLIFTDSVQEANIVPRSPINIQSHETVTRFQEIINDSMKALVRPPVTETGEMDWLALRLNIRRALSRSRALQRQLKNHHSANAENLRFELADKLHIQEHQAGALLYLSFLSGNSGLRFGQYFNDLPTERQWERQKDWIHQTISSLFDRFNSQLNRDHEIEEIGSLLLARSFGHRYQRDSTKTPYAIQILFDSKSEGSVLPQNLQPMVSRLPGSPTIGRQAWSATLSALGAREVPSLALPSRDVAGHRFMQELYSTFRADFIRYQHFSQESTLLPNQSLLPKELIQISGRSALVDWLIIPMIHESQGGILIKSLSRYEEHSRQDSVYYWIKLRDMMGHLLNPQGRLVINGQSITRDQIWVTTRQGHMRLTELEDFYWQNIHFSRDPRENLTGFITSYHSLFQKNFFTWLLPQSNTKAQTPDELVSSASPVTWAVSTLTVATILSSFETLIGGRSSVAEAVALQETRHPLRMTPLQFDFVAHLISFLNAPPLRPSGVPIFLQADALISSQKSRPHFKSITVSEHESRQFADPKAGGINSLYQSQLLQSYRLGDLAMVIRDRLPSEQYKQFDFQLKTLGINPTQLSKSFWDAGTHSTLGLLKIALQCLQTWNRTDPNMKWELISKIHDTDLAYSLGVQHLLAIIAKLPSRVSTNQERLALVTSVSEAPKTLSRREVAPEAIDHALAQLRHGKRKAFYDLVPDMVARQFMDPENGGWAVIKQVYSNTFKIAPRENATKEIAYLLVENSKLPQAEQYAIIEHYNFINWKAFDSNTLSFNRNNLPPAKRLLGAILIAVNAWNQHSQSLSHNSSTHRKILNPNAIWTREFAKTVLAPIINSAN